MLRQRGPRWAVTKKGLPTDSQHPWNQPQREITEAERQQRIAELQRELDASLGRMKDWEKLDAYMRRRGQTLFWDLLTSSFEDNEIIVQGLKEREIVWRCPTCGDRYGDVPQKCKHKGGHYEPGDKRAAVYGALDLFRHYVGQMLRRHDTRSFLSRDEHDHAVGALFYADRVWEAVEENDAAQTMLNTMILVSSLIASTALQFAEQAVRSAVGREKSHTKSRLRGVLLAIADLQKDSRFEKKRAPIWDHLRKLERDGTPWQMIEDHTTYRITFKDRDTLIHTAECAGKKNNRPLSKQSFLKHYFD